MTNGRISNGTINRRARTPTTTRSQLAKQRWLRPLPVQVISRIFTLKTKLGWWASPSAFSNTYTGRTPLLMPYSCRTWIGVFLGLGDSSGFNLGILHRYRVYPSWSGLKVSEEKKKSSNALPPPRSKWSIRGNYYYTVANNIRRLISHDIHIEPWELSPFNAAYVLYQW